MIDADRDIDSICVLMGIITGSRLACQIIRKKLHFLLPMQPYLWMRLHALRLLRQQLLNPTLGIILCSDTDEDIAKYSILHGHEQLFASKYKTCLPSEEQLREEIEIQKRFYYLQKEEDKENKDF